MSIKLTPVQGDHKITVLAIEGDLDASRFREVMTKAEEVLGAGAHYIIVDLSELNFMSSSGLSALHSMNLMMQKVEAQEAIEQDEDQESTDSRPTSLKQGHVKLLQPQPRVLDVLEKTGFTEIFEVYETLDAAAASCV